MGGKPVSIAIAALIQEGKILLIKRVSEPYLGLWSLPGGKIEKDEHVSDAALREIKEETGIDAKFIDHSAVVSELLKEKDDVNVHFLIHLCELQPKHTNIVQGNEGDVQWFALEEMKNMKEKVILSDWEMIEKIILQKNKGYYNCVMRKDGENHTLEKFEKIS